MLWNGNECSKNLSNDNLKATILSTDFDRSKTIECGMLQYLGNTTKGIRIEREIKFKTVMTKVALRKKYTLFSPANLT